MSGLVRSTPALAAVLGQLQHPFSAGAGDFQRDTRRKSKDLSIPLDGPLKVSDGNADVMKGC